MGVIYFCIFLVASYIIWLFLKLGFHQRLPFIFRRFSFEEIPMLLASKYGDRVIATTDDPVRWVVPQQFALADSYSWTANKFNDSIGYVSGLLKKQLAIAHADRVAVLKKNHFDYHVLNAAVVRAGGIACPLHEDFIAEKLNPYLNNIGAKILISDVATFHRLLAEDAGLGPVECVVFADSKLECDQGQFRVIQQYLSENDSTISWLWIEDGLEKVEQPMSPIKRGKGEPIYMTHTSGTTGFPKSVILKNESQCLAAKGILALSGLTRNDHCYFALPHNHLATLATLNALLLLGVKAHWSSKCKFDFDPKATLANLADGKFTTFMGFPIAYTQLTDQSLQNYDLSSMRIWACTADVTHEVVQRKFVKHGNFFKSLGMPIKGSVFIDALGSSETGIPVVVRFATSLTKKFDRRIGVPGLVPFAPKTKVVKPNGELAAVGEIGRFYVKGKTVTEGYWNNHAKTYLEKRDGWLFTGDIVRRERDRHIVQLDREVDVIHTAQGHVYTLPIEEQAHKHEAVFDACVYGARQHDGTQRPAVVVAVRSDANITEEQLLKQLNWMLSSNEQLCSLKIIPWKQFPIGLTGKTLKRFFRNQTEKLPVAEDNRPVGA